NAVPISIGIDIIPNGNAMNRSRRGIGLGRRYGRAGDRNGILDIEVAKRILDLTNGLLHRRKNLIMINSRFVNCYQLKIGAEGVWLVAAVDDLILQIPTKPSAAARNINRDKTWLREREMQDPNLAVGFADIFGILDVDLRPDLPLVGVALLGGKRARDQNQHSNRGQGKRATYSHPLIRSRHLRLHCPL